MRLSCPLITTLGVLEIKQRLLGSLAAVKKHDTGCRTEIVEVFFLNLPQQRFPFPIYFYILENVTVET